jgi:hypothetical protein
MKESSTPQRKQPLFGNNTPTRREEAKLYDSADEKSTLKEEDLANALRSLSGSSELTGRQGDPTHPHRHIQVSKPKLHVDKSDTVDQRNVQETNKLLAFEVQENNRNDPAQPLRALLDHEDARYQPKLDLLNIIKALQIHWKLLLRHALQTVGLITILRLVVHHLTYNGRAAVASITLYSAPPMAE